MFMRPIEDRGRTNIIIAVAVMPTGAYKISLMSLRGRMSERLGHWPIDRLLMSHTAGIRTNLRIPYNHAGCYMILRDINYHIVSKEGK